MTEVKTDTALARRVGELVGGSGNVSSVHNCTTRLRFVVRDKSLVDFDELKKTPGVLQAVNAGGQVQVVIGTHVDRVRDELVRLPGWKELANSEGAGNSERRRLLDAVFDFLGSTFQPLLAPITGAAMVQVLVLLLTQFGVLPADSPTAGILTATGNAVFYFLPVFVAFTASQKLGVNPFVGATIAAALLHPGFTGIGEQGTVAQAFGLPLFMYSYANLMFPALLVALALAGLDRLLKKAIPSALQQIGVPTLELLILVPVTALLFGPIGVAAGNGLAGGINWLSTTAPFLFYVIVPALWVFFVALGIHWALISIVLVEFSTGQGSAMFGAAFGYQYAMMGVALGILIRTVRNRNKNLRTVAAGASLAVVIGGITEPTLYGIVLRYRRILIIEIIAAAASGAMLGLFNTVGIGFSPAPILGLPLMQPILGGIMGMAVGVILPIVLIQIWGYEAKSSTSAAPETGGSSSPKAGFVGALEGTASPGELTIGSPLAGSVKPLADTSDPIFSGGLIGPGVAVLPAGGRVVAPASGTIVAVPDSAHAIGMRMDDGVEILIHVGIDTVRLKGQPFTLHVVQGQRVRAGDLLLEFDTSAIEKAGHSVITPVVITNLKKDQQVDILASGDIVEGTPLLKVRAKDA